MLKHNFSQTSLKEITKTLESGVIGFGPLSKQLEETFSVVNHKHNIATNSASAAAFMIFAYLREKYGKCDIFTPSLAFTSPIWAAKHFGHDVVWVDVDDNLLMDINDYYKKRKNRYERYSDGGIKPVLMPILYGGVSTIPGFEDIKGGYSEIVVVDAAHCPLPTIKSDFAFTSFHPTKPICSPDGGLITTNNKEAAEYFYSYRNFGRKNLDEGYDIIQNGFKFYMNNLSATIALESLKDYSKLRKIRKENFEKLQDIFEGRFLEHDNNSSYYFATLITDQSEYAEYLNKKYNLSKHYPLLHKTLYYEDYILPNTERLHQKIVNLPLYNFKIYE